MLPHMIRTLIITSITIFVLYNLIIARRHFVFQLYFLIQGEFLFVRNLDVDFQGYHKADTNRKTFNAVSAVKTKDQDHLRSCVQCLR